jgi:ferredoxin
MAGIHRITLEPAGLAFSCGAEENLLQALQRVGVAPALLAAIPVGCRGGGCGVCRIRVRSGQFRTGRMSRKHISEADEAAGTVLACRVFPESDLEIEVDLSAANPITRSSTTVKRQGG